MKPFYQIIQRIGTIKLLSIGLISLTFHSQAQFQGSGIHDRHEHDPRDWSRGDWLEINHDHNAIDRIGIRFRNSGSYYWNIISDKDDGLRFLRNSTNSGNASVVFTTDQGLWVKASSDANQVKGRDWVYGINRLITDGDIELGANKVIKRRGSSEGKLSIIGFNRFDVQAPIVNNEADNSPESYMGYVRIQDTGIRNEFINEFIIGDYKGDGLGTENFTERLKITPAVLDLNLPVRNAGTTPHGFSQLVLGDNDGILLVSKEAGGAEFDGDRLDKHGIEIARSGENRITTYGNSEVDGDFSIISSDATIKNQHIQINSDRVSADGLSTSQDLLLTDNDGINLRSDNIIIENKDGNATDDQLTIRSTNTNLETNLYGKNGTVTFKDAVFIESVNGLTVAETINAKDLNITPGSAPGAPDYVFEESYDLRTLKEVESHIKEEGHLPEVPSAKEIEEEGYTIVEMDFTLLKKVEELTLYLLQLKEENEQLSQRIKLLESREN